MFPINFAAMTFGGIGSKVKQSVEISNHHRRNLTCAHGSLFTRHHAVMCQVLAAAAKHGVGVIALKACARGSLSSQICISLR